MKVNFSNINSYIYSRLTASYSLLILLLRYHTDFINALICTEASVFCLLMLFLQLNRINAYFHSFLLVLQVTFIHNQF